MHVRVSLTGWRIALLSAEARRLYKPYPASHVPENLRTLAVYVEAIPHDARSPVIEHVVLKAKNRNNVVQPNNVKNEDGGAFARFPVAGTRDLPAGDIDVVVITKGGERRCKLGAKDRARLFGGL